MGNYLHLLYNIVHLTRAHTGSPMLVHTSLILLSIVYVKSQKKSHAGMEPSKTRWE